MKQIVFLIGYMGVGKTTVGKRLSNYLNVEFIDTDRVIEGKFDCSIAEYFTKYGEESFRLEEQSVLKSIIKNKKAAIVSVGGGLPCFLGNMDLMNENGTTVYLHRPAKELFQRLKQRKSSRPLIADMSDDELLKFIDKSVSERERFYMRANYIADRDNQETKELANMINKYS